MVRAVGELERGRESYAKQAWLDAYGALTAADQAVGLGAEDLELLGRSAYMLGRDDDYVAAWSGHIERTWMPARLCAPCDVRSGSDTTCCFAARRFALGDGSRARNGLLEREGRDSVERGWLLIPAWLEQMARGDWEAGYATAAEAAAIGERFGDADLVWLARDDQGRALLAQGRVEEGLRLVDEALVVAAAGELSPLVTGIVYCNTIAFCRDAYEIRHAREWTDALTGGATASPR